MAFMNPTFAWGGVMLAYFTACDPVRVIAFQNTAGDPSIGTGGVFSMGGAGNGEPTQTWLIDDFEDQDHKANDPAGWWYSVNDGSGPQEISFVAVTDGYAMQIVSGSFAEWGSAIGVDVVGYDLPQSPTELEFYLRADRPFEASFHAIDGSGEHFTRPLTVGETWNRYVVRLDQMFFVDGDVVRRLDVTTLDELHWFFFENEPVIVWLDQVSLRSF